MLFLNYIPENKTDIYIFNEIHTNSKKQNKTKNSVTRSWILVGEKEDFRIAQMIFTYFGQKAPIQSFCVLPLIQ